MSATEAPDTTVPLTLARRGTDRTPETRTVLTCQQYLSAVGAGFYPAGALDLALEQIFARDCFLLRDLGNVHAASVSYIPNWSYAWLTILPPILQWGQYDHELSSTLSWGAAFSGLHGVSLSTETLRAEDDFAIYDLQLVGQGDFNNDGVADVALAASVRVKAGSYQRNDYYVLTRCATQGLMVRISATTKPFLVEGHPCH